MRQQLLKWLIQVSRFILALVFIFSGYVKAIDPMGTQYKLQDYLGALHLTGAVPQLLLLGTSVALSALEFTLGILLLFAIRRRQTSRLTFIFMVFMTLVTLGLALSNTVKDCGCFGDAIHLTNTQTLLKNIVLLACSAVVGWKPLYMTRFVRKNTQWIIINYTLVFTLINSLWSLYDLPQFDFRPYRIGVNIPQAMETPAGAPRPQYETTFILSKNGQQKIFTLDNYPDSTWTFIDSKTTLVKAGYVPPIHDFAIEDLRTGDDLTTKILQHKGYTFLLIAPHLETADDSNFGDIDQLYEYAQQQRIPFYGLTASTDKAIRRWIDLTGAEYPFFSTDETALKTIIRSNPGLLLLHNGTIINKWSHNALPAGDDLSRPIAQATWAKMPQDSVPSKIIVIVLWFVLPLFLLTLADRFWAWSQWVRLKEKKNKDNLYQLFNKKNQYEKENGSR